MCSIQQQLAERKSRLSKQNPLSITNPTTNSKRQNQTIDSQKYAYSLIVDYWFRTTSKSKSNGKDNKEEAITAIITQYCSPIFRTLPIPKEEHGYGQLPNGITIYPTSNSFQALLQSIQLQPYFGNKSDVLQGLSSPINWDEEFVVIIVSHQGAPPQSIDFKSDEYEITNDNSLIMTIEQDNGRTDTAKACVMCYYAFCIVVDRMKGFNRIGVKHITKETQVPQCNVPILPTDGLADINRKMTEFYDSLTPNDYKVNVYQHVQYKAIE